MPERRREEPDSAPPQSRQVHDDLENILRNLFLSEVATPRESRRRMRDFEFLRGEDAYDQHVRDAYWQSRDWGWEEPNKGTPYPRVPYTSDVPSDRAPASVGELLFGATRPYVEPPPGWGSSINVGPGSDVAQMLRRLENVVPGISGLVGDITMGPDSGYIESALDEDPGRLGYGRRPLLRTNTLGTYNPKSHDIYLSPQGGRGTDLFGTLSHELLHKSEGAWADHVPAYIAGELARMMYAPLTPEEIGNRVLRGGVYSERDREVALGLDELLSGLPWYESQRQGPIDHTEYSPRFW